MAETIVVFNPLIVIMIIITLIMIPVICYIRKIKYNQRILMAVLRPAIEKLEADLCNPDSSHSCPNCFNSLTLYTCCDDTKITFKCNMCSFEIKGVRHIDYVPYPTKNQPKSPNHPFKPIEGGIYGDAADV